MSSILGKGPRRHEKGGHAPALVVRGPDGTGRHVGARSAVADDPARARWVVRAIVWAMLAVAIAAWLVAVAGIRLSDTGGLGLINAFPMPYYVAVTICVTAILLSLVWSPFSRLACLSGLGTFIVMIFGTPPMVYAEPQFAWVYKHLGVIEYLMAHGSTNRAIDIYQNWPGLFAGNALLSTATGVHPLAYAGWAPVFFEFALMGAVLFALGGVIANERRRHAVAFIWIAGSWIGQDYLSPQAVSIVMVIAVLGVALRIGTAGGWDRPSRGRVGSLGDRIRTSLANVLYWAVRRPRSTRHDGPPRIVRRTVTDRDRWTGMGLMLVLGVAVITSHQLSPVMMLLDLGLVALFCGWRRLWPIIIALAVCEVAWIALAWPFVSNFGLVTFGGPVAPQVEQGVPLAGVVLVGEVSRAIGIAYWLLAIVGAVRMLRRIGGDPATPAIFGAFALAPNLVVPFQSYGGEVSLRAYLFSLPWMAALAVEAVWPSGARLPGRRAAARSTAGPSGQRLGLAGWRQRPWGLAIVGPLLVAGTIITYFGYALTNWMTPSDVAAATWVETNVPAHSTVIFLSESLPYRLTARYPLVVYYPLAVTDSPANVIGMQIAGQRVASVRTALAAVGAKHVFLVVSPSMLNYDREQGVISRANVQATVSGLLAAADIKTVYNHDGAYVFEYTAP
jgi:hypothetical protein